jgi:CrcB protein
VTAVLVCVGAGVGAFGRWWVDQAVQSAWVRGRSNFPYGTLLINTLGSLVLGLLLGGTGGVGPLVALGGTGLCGGFTTFSTFGYETVRLVELGAFRRAVANVAASLALGLPAAYAGWALGRSLWG